MRRHVVVGIFALLMLAVPLAFAERTTYVPDPPHSQMNFVGESMFVSAPGYFERWEGDFQIDRQNLENSTVALTIDAASLNTRIQMRDNHLRSKEFFDTATYPQVKFTSTGISKVDDKNYVITGNLTLHGVAKQIQVPVNVVFLRDHDGRFKGEMKLNRRDFGINGDSRMNPIADMVTVQFDMHLQEKQAQPAP